VQEFIAIRPSASMPKQTPRFAIAPTSAPLAKKKMKAHLQVSRASACLSIPISRALPTNVISAIKMNNAADRPDEARAQKHDFLFHHQRMRMLAFSCIRW